MLKLWTNQTVRVFLYTAPAESPDGVIMLGLCAMMFLPLSDLVDTIGRLVFLIVYTPAAESDVDR